MTTINTLDPATPDPNDIVGLGDDEIRALKQVITGTFSQTPTDTPADPWDIPLAVGPRTLASILTAASAADLAALDTRVGAIEGSLAGLVTALAALDIRTVALETNAVTAAQALDAAFPVGTLYVAADGISPTTKGIPGTWIVQGDDRFLLGSNSNFGDEGGNENSELVLEETNLPQHKHQHSTYREDSGTTALDPTFFTEPVTTFMSHSAGRSASSAENAIFNTDEGVNLLENPTPIDLSPAFLRVRFFSRIA